LKIYISQGSAAMQ